jgi:hypothetical protein
MSLRSFWSWVWTQEDGGTSTAEVKAQQAKTDELAERSRKFCERLGIFGDNPRVPLEDILEQLLERIEDLERANGGRARLRVLRDWPKERGD